MANIRVKNGKITPATSDKTYVVEVPEDYDYIIIKPLRKTEEILPYCKEKAIESGIREYTAEELKKISKKVIKPPKEHPYNIFVRECGEINPSNADDSDSGTGLGLDFSISNKK